MLGNTSRVKICPKLTLALTFHAAFAHDLTTPSPRVAESIPKEWEHYPIVGGIKPEEWNGFHDFVLWDELYRGGAIGSIFVGLTVGAPPLRLYASEQLKAKIMPDILSGQKRICLAIAEASAGSDVRNLTTTVIKSADGSKYVVNDEKWITNGMFSDYFMAAVWTGGLGAGGISMLLIDRHLLDIKCRKDRDRRR